MSALESGRPPVPPPPDLRERASALLRSNRRPVVLATISFVCLAAHHVLVRVMAHGHVAHVLLSAGNAPPPAGAAVMAVGLVIVRFVSVILVPGLLLAAAAELAAYLLVGPARMEDVDDPLSDEVGGP